MIFGPETETDLATWRRLTRPGSGSAPLLIETSQMPSGRTLQVPPDSTLRLKCIAQGEPEPHLIWFKVNMLNQSIAKQARYFILRNSTLLLFFYEHQAKRLSLAQVFVAVSEGL